MVQLSLLPESDRPRKCIIAGDEYVSVLDALRIYGKSSNERTDWKRITAKLIKQGYDVSELLHHQFRDSSGKLNRATPVVNKVQIARIAQITDYPEWEYIRQAQAEIFVEVQQAKRIKNPRHYRHLLASGYTSQEADTWQEVDTAAVEIRKQIVPVWVQRGGSIPRLTNHVTYLVIGETASIRKKTQYIKGSLRKFMSPLEKAAISIVEGLGKALHIQRDSQGNAELERDLSDASQFIDMDKLKKFSDKPVLPPNPKPIQHRLPRA